MKAKKLPPKLQDWVDARKRHHLSHAHVQMARELGLNPKKLGKIDNHKQELWKAPLPVFIEEIYAKRFAKSLPEGVMSIEQIFKVQEQKKALKAVQKLAAKQLDEPILFDREIKKLLEKDKKTI
jgi:hypothetical protein